jgi:hypothetical protein
MRENKEHGMKLELPSNVDRKKRYIRDAVKLCQLERSGC